MSTVSVFGPDNAGWSKSTHALDAVRLLLLAPHTQVNSTTPREGHRA